MKEFTMGDEPEELAPVDPKPKQLLTIELVPSTSWGNNLRAILPRKDWDILRRAQYVQAGHVCEVCGGRGPHHPVECHERWMFDMGAHKQVLVGLIALCPKCHGVKHIGRTMDVKGPQGMLDAQLHMSRVNGWSLGQSDIYIQDAFRTYHHLSQFQWEVDISWAQEALQKLKSGS